MRRLTFLTLCRNQMHRTSYCACVASCFMLQDTPGVNEQKVAEDKFREIAVAYQELLVRHVDGADNDDVHCINC